MGKCCAFLRVGKCFLGTSEALIQENRQSGKVWPTASLTRLWWSTKNPLFISKIHLPLMSRGRTNTLFLACSPSFPAQEIIFLSHSPLFPLKQLFFFLFLFRSDHYREDVHSSTYHCRATNRLGTVLGRSVRVRAGGYDLIDTHTYTFSRTHLRIKYLSLF